MFDILQPGGKKNQEWLIQNRLACKWSVPKLQIAKLKVCSWKEFGNQLLTKLQSSAE
jgi:hypothetical protein